MRTRTVKLSFLIMLLLITLSTPKILQSNQLDLGYSLRYWIPSTIFDIPINQMHKNRRQELLQALFVSNYGGCTLYEWNTTKGSYLSHYISGKIINEEISIIETFISENMWNNTKDELLDALALYSCVMFEQESFLYHYNNNKQQAKIIFCDEKQIKAIGIKHWTICCNQQNHHCNIYFENNLNNDEIEWDICIEWKIDCLNSDECQSTLMSAIQSLQTNCAYTHWSTQYQCFAHNEFAIV
eukprot:138500_1